MLQLVDWCLIVFAVAVTVAVAVAFTAVAVDVFVDAFISLLADCCLTNVVVLAGNVGDMLATRQNVANICPDRPILATWFTVCWHTFVLLFPNIYVPQTENNRVSLLLIPTSNVDLHNRHPPTKHTKIIRHLHPLASHLLHLLPRCRLTLHLLCLFVCLFICSFDWLLCRLSAPCCCVLSRRIATPRH